MLEEQMKCPNCGVLEYINFFGSAKEYETFETVCCYCGITRECEWYITCDISIKKGSKSHGEIAREKEMLARKKKKENIK
jgi:hypothetical protein